MNEKLYKVSGFVSVTLTVSAESADQAIDLFKSTQLADCDLGNVVPSKAELLEGCKNEIR